jgi:hypothetical protein
VSNGHGDHPFDDAHAFDDDGPGISLAGPKTLAMDPDEVHPPGRVMELAAAAVRFMFASLKIEPDFSREALALLDHYTTEARAAVAERPETLPLTAHTLGAYLGEVVRMHHRCWWRIDPADPSAWRLEFGNVFLAFYPVQVMHTALLRHEGARDREEGQEEASFSGFELDAQSQSELAERLENLPGVSEDTYFTPSLKAEILDILVDALLAKRARDPDAARPFVPADYEAH